jgi:hypothetical protein
METRIQFVGLAGNNQAGRDSRSPGFVHQMQRSGEGPIWLFDTGTRSVNMAFTGRLSHIQLVLNLPICPDSLYKELNS